MKQRKVILVFCILFYSLSVLAQNAPVTYLPDTVACTGNLISIPVRVNNFKNIGSVSLKLQYNNTSLVYQSWSNTSGFTGLKMNSAISGTLVIGGFNNISGGTTLPDQSVFFTINFLYQGGIGTLNWFDNGASCEYAGPSPNFPVLNDIPQSSYYINGTVNRSLIPQFSSTVLFPEVGDTVYFTDQSTGFISGWQWSFLPSTVSAVNGTTLQSQNPFITFDNNGPYAVQLTITSTGCSDSLIKSDYIHAGTPGLWTGILSEDWNVPQNWHNWVIPDQVTNVLIPSVAAHYPEYPGDFTIGIQCYNLTIEGTTGRFTVQGNFQLP